MTPAHLHVVPDVVDDGCDAFDDDVIVRVLDHLVHNAAWRRAGSLWVADVAGRRWISNSFWVVPADGPVAVAFAERGLPITPGRYLVDAEQRLIRASENVIDAIERVLVPMVTTYGDQATPVTVEGHRVVRRHPLPALQCAFHTGPERPIVWVNDDYVRFAELLAPPGVELRWTLNPTGSTAWLVAYAPSDEGSQLHAVVAPFSEVDL